MAGCLGTIRPLFWITWGVVLVGINLPTGVILSQCSALTKSYTIGVDEGTDEHRIPSLAWPRYRLELRFEAANWKGLGDPDSSIRDLIGGDLEVELKGASGQLIAPRRFALGDATLGAALKHSGRSLSEHRYALGEFDAKTLDAATLRVIARKTTPRAWPRRAELRLFAPDTGYTFIFLVFADGILVLIAIAGAFVQLAVGGLGKSCRPRSRSHTTCATGSS